MQPTDDPNDDASGRTSQIEPVLEGVVNDETLPSEYFPSEFCDVLTLYHRDDGVDFMYLPDNRLTLVEEWYHPEGGGIAYKVSTDKQTGWVYVHNMTWAFFPSL